MIPTKPEAHKIVMLYVYYAEEFPGRMEINRITVEAEPEDIAKFE